MASRLARVSEKERRRERGREGEGGSGVERAGRETEEKSEEVEGESEEERDTIACRCVICLFQVASSENLAHSFMSFNTCYNDTGLW